MDNAVSISEQTNKVLAIYRDFNRVANELWKYFKPEEREGERPIKDAYEVAESRYKPFVNSVNDINAKLLEEISSNIENAVVFGNYGDTTTQI